MISRIINIIKRDGIRLFLVKLIAKVLRIDIGLTRHKKKLWSILREKYNYKVAYGPFKGMSLPQRLWWGDDRITQTLGIYEEHVLEKLRLFSMQGATRFIDIGAANGYFAIGMAYSKIYAQIFAFEIEPQGQELIKENAIRNRCSDVVSVFGEASYSSLKNLLSEDIKTTILIDIEGAEYKLLSKEMLSLLSNCYLIIELHPWLVDEDNNLQDKLLEMANKKFNVELIKRENYSPNIFPEMDDLSDEERLIAVGEGRTKNMQWLVLTPLQNSQKL